MRNFCPSPLMWTVEALAVAKKDEDKNSRQWNKTFCMNFKEVLQNHEQGPMPCDKSTNLQDKYKPVKSRLVPKTMAA